MDRSQGNCINGNGAGLDGHKRRHSSYEIEAEIQHSRAEMDLTMRAIQERLRPASIVKHLLGLVETPGEAQKVSNVVGGMLSKAGQCAMRHPGPTALLGLGTAWYFMQAFEKDKVAFDAVKSAGEGIASSAKDKFTNVKDAAKEKITDVTSTAKEKLGEVTASTREAASRVISKGRETVHNVTQSVGHGLQSGTKWYRQTTDEYPAAAAAGMVALGLIVGLIIPHTHAEDEFMGERADRLKEKGKEKGQELLNVGSQVATQVVDKASQVLREEGISANQLLDKVQHVASETAETAKEVVLDAASGQLQNIKEGIHAGVMENAGHDEEDGNFGSSRSGTAHRGGLQSQVGEQQGGKVNQGRESGGQQMHNQWQ